MVVIAVFFLFFNTKILRIESRSTIFVSASAFLVVVA